jgi:ribonuclease HI
MESHPLPHAKINLYYRLYTFKRFFKCLLPFPCSLAQTVNGNEMVGALFAIHEALQKVESDKILVIFCTSKMVIHQLCYAAAKKLAIGWPGPNGDIFKDTVLLLRKRHGRTTLVHIESKAGNDRKQEAYSLAKAALEVPQSGTLFEPTVANTVECNNPHAPLPDMRKVVTDLEETSPERPKPWKNWEDNAEDNVRESHRGRPKVHELQSGLQAELLACKNIKEFWDFVRKRTDARPKKAKVSLNALARDFEERLNYPETQSATFNSNQLAFNARMARELEMELPDTSPRQSYTRDITRRY